jgi:hypothetical protein
VVAEKDTRVSIDKVHRGPGSIGSTLDEESTMACISKKDFIRNW